MSEIPQTSAPEPVPAPAQEETEALADLPFWKTVLYALGNAAGLLTYNTFNSFIQFFYTDHVGLPPQWVGRGWFAFGFWNAVNDPIAGWLSDNTQSRIGRRTLFIRLLAIPVAVAFALVWLPPLDVEQHGATPVLVYFLVIISIYDMLQSIITLNQDALFPEMFQNTEVRARGSSIRQFIGFGLGGGLAIALSPAIYDSALGWTGLALIWGSVAALFYFLSLIGIEENPAYAQDAPSLSIGEQARLALRNRTFLIVLGINFVFRFIFAVLLAALPFYAEYVLNLDGEQTSILLTALVIATVVSLIVWQRIFQRFGTRRALIASFAIAAFCALPILFTTSLVATALVLGALGLGVGGALLLGPDMLFAEVIDEDYVKTGARREGLYRGILGFMFRFPPAFAGLILGEALAVSGYDADLSVAEQPVAVENTIRAFTAFAPIVAIVFGIALLLLYPLYGERLRAIQQRAAQMRAELFRRTSQQS
ncbi:MAG: MFS transporter [Chloroflexi bacterium]|nr:MFS transporter [Chloroflexota bacterium]